jgi:adenine C2-methylase RlmN of 23S rRNA A2503 and tRNA A37
VLAIVGGVVVNVVMLVVGEPLWNVVHVRKVVGATAPECGAQWKVMTTLNQGGCVTMMQFAFIGPAIEFDVDD